MTITTNATRNEYTATSGQTVFNYTFKIFADTELSVYQTATGATPNDTSDLITAYTVSGVGNENGGSITLTTGATLNDKITIVSNIAQSRTTDYQFNGDFSADVVDDDFDRTVSLVKQLSDEINRTPRFDKAVQGLSGVKIAPPVASEFLRWNVAGTDLESVSLNTAAAGDNAAAISYSNTTSGLSATDVQGAIDEIDSTIDTILTTPVVSSGVYTPSITAQSNVASITNLTECRYFRVGSVVSVSGYITVAATILGSVSFEMSLPIPSNFTTVRQLTGASMPNNLGTSPDDAYLIIGSIANDTALFTQIDSVAGEDVGFNFSYEII